MASNADAIKRMLNSHESHSRAPYLKKDHGLEMLKIEEGLMRMDILGWPIKKQKDPQRTTTTMDIGSLAPWRYFRLHKDVGPSRDRVVCPASTYGKRCPICEESNKAFRAGADKSVLETFYNSARRLWICRVEDQLFLGDTSDHNVGKAVEAWLKSDLERNASFYFHKGAEGGRTLKVLFAAEKANIGGKSVNMFKAANVSSVPRKDVIPSAMLKDIPDLDTLLVEHSYDELKEMWNSTASDNDDDDEPRRKKGKKSSAPVAGIGKKKKPRDDEDDDEDEDEDEDDDEDEEIPFDSEDDEEDDDDDDDEEEEEESLNDEEEESLNDEEEEALNDEDDDDDDDDPSPPSRKKTGTKLPSKPKKRADDDDDEDEDEEIVTKPSSRNPKGKVKPAAKKRVSDPDEDDDDDDDEDDEDDEDEEHVQLAPKGKAKPAKPAAATGKAKPGKPLSSKKKWPSSK